MKLKTPLFKSLSGSVAQAFQGVYPTCRTRADGVIILQVKPIPTYGRSAAQDAQRTAFKDAVDGWNALTPGEQEQWNLDAEPYFITGYNYYLKLHLATQLKNYNPSQDAAVKEHYPDTNYGTDDHYALFDMLNWVVRIYMKFDYSDIPSDAIITSAILSVFYFGEYGTPTSSKKIRLHRVVASWDEGTITWNNKPAFYALTYEETTVGQEGTWRTFDVKDIVQGHVSGSNPNYGYLIRFMNENNPPETEPGWYSREYATQKPILRVEYS